MKLLQKSGKNNEKSTKNIKKQEKIIKNQPKTDKNGKSLEDQYAELKEKNSSVLKKNRKTSKKPKRKPVSQANTSTKTTNKKNGGDKMSNYNDAVKALKAVCKELKLPAPREKNTQSKSGVKVFEAFNAKGERIACVRANDIVIWRPQSKIGFGRKGPKHWEHVTVLSLSDSNAKAAFKKAFGIKKTKEEWIKELKVKPRVQKAVKTVKDIRVKKAALKAEMKALDKAEKSLSKKKKTIKKKVSGKGASAIAKVAGAKA